MMKSFLLRDGVKGVYGMLLSGLFVLVLHVDAVDYYCDKNEPLVMISGNSSGNIYSLYQGDTFYQNNQHCQWLIDAGVDNLQIQLMVKKSDLEWAPEGAICSDQYDFVDVRDGNSTSSKPAAVWCGRRSPRSVVSTGRYLLISFRSDPRNQYKYGGVHLTFDVFNSDDCPLFYSTPNNMFCYSLVSARKVNWVTAQAYCNNEQANLVSVHSETENNFLKALSSDSGLGWIGLNKISSENTNTWIDKSSLNYTKFDPGVSVSTDDDCMTFDYTSGLWSGSDCLRFKANFFCKMNKGRSTQLFFVPDKGDANVADEPNVIFLILGTVLGAVCVFILIILSVVCYKKSRQTTEQVNREDNSSEIACHDDDRTRHFSSAAEPKTDHSSAYRLDDQKDKASGRVPSAPHRLRQSQHVAPPAYEDALNDPVMI